MALAFFFKPQDETYSSDYTLIDKMNGAGGILCSVLYNKELCGGSFAVRINSPVTNELSCKIYYIDV
jgi:hypothetical protein